MGILYSRRQSFNITFAHIMQKTTQCLTSTFKLFPFSDGRVMVTASCPPDKRPLSGLWSKVGATAIKSCQRSLVDGLMWNSLLFKSMIKFHSIDKFIGKWSIVIVEAPTWMWKHLDRVLAWLWEVSQKQVGWGTWLVTPQQSDLKISDPTITSWNLNNFFS